MHKISPIFYIATSTSTSSPAISLRDITRVVGREVVI